MPRIPTLFVLACVLSAAEPAPIALSAIPSQPLRAQLSGLPAAGRAAALAAFARDPSLLAHTDHLGISPSGSIYFKNCPCQSVVAPAAAAPSAAPGIPVGAPIAVTAVPAYSSLPGSTRTIYLDFNGEAVTGTNWNADPDFGSVATWNARAFSLDGDYTLFSDVEQDAIYLIWQRIAEDYRIFDVNVTTVRPTAPGVLGGANISWVLITDSTDGVNACPADSAGGVAYLNGFGSAVSAPAWVYVDNLGSEDVIAEAASHEAGHNMGLYHDGTPSTPATEYYPGHGSPLSWAPIMGVGYNKEMTQWSRGEFANARNGYWTSSGTVWNPIAIQDDIALISGYLGLVADAVDAPIGAFTAGAAGTRDVTAFNALINSAADVDLYTFDCMAGTATFTITPQAVTSLGFISPATQGANLDVQADILDAGLNVLFSSNPTNAIGATVTGALPASGVYYLRVRPAGNLDPLNTGYSTYGSVGRYRVTGNVPAGIPTSLGFTASTIVEPEGSTGPRVVTLYVTRGAGSLGPATVLYDTSDQMATAASGDYTAVTGGLIAWAPGDPLTKAVSIVVNGDTDEESDESFLVTLRNPTDASLNANITVMIALRNDDGASAALAASSAASIQPSGTGDDTSCGAGAVTGLLLGIGGLGLVRRRRR